MATNIVYVDASVLIAAARGADDIARPALEVLDNPDNSFASSIFVRLEALIPDRSEQSQILNIVDIPKAALGSLQRSVEQLDQLKHGLMPDLLTGRARGKGAEARELDASLRDPLCSG